MLDPRSRHSAVFANLPQVELATAKNFRPSPELIGYLSIWQKILLVFKRDESHCHAA